jgi:enoyl-CoA hydratase/carnithine racemase
MTMRFRVASVPAEQLVTVSLPGGDSPTLWNALSAAGRSLTGAVRVVVLRGEAADFFDGTALDDSHDEPPVAAIEWLGRPDLVTIAAITGQATGAGLDVALACDLRVAAEDAELAASRSVTGAARLGELMGYPRALAFVVGGAVISGRDAVASNLTNLSVPSDTLDATVADMVAAILRMPREVATVAKAALGGSAADGRRRADELVAGLRLARNEA